MPTLSTSDSSDSEPGPGGGDLVRFLVGAVLPVVGAKVVVPMDRGYHIV